MTNWYRTAWEKTWNAATDDEAAALEAAAVRGGVLLKCEACGYCTPSDEGPTCGNCEEPVGKSQRKNGVLPTT